MEESISVQQQGCPVADSNLGGGKRSKSNAKMAAEPQQPSTAKGFILYKIANTFTKIQDFFLSA